MIEIFDLTDENIFGLRIDGVFETADVRRVYEALLEKMKGQDRFRIYAEVPHFDFGDVSREIIETEIKYVYRHPEIIVNLEKVAMVTDLGWLRKIAAVEFALIPTLEGKVFSFAEKQRALEWLSKNERDEQQRLNVVYPELVELGWIKALGGFAVGILAANYLSKNQRKKIGAAALVGSFVFGIPFAVKFFNNNRKLLVGRSKEVEQ